MYKTENLLQFSEMTRQLLEIQRKEICEAKSGFNVCLKSAVFPIIRLRVALQPRNIFGEFPIDLQSSIIQEISAEVFYPDVGQTQPISITFQHFFLTDDGNTIIAESRDVVPAILRAKNPGAGGPVDSQTGRALIDGFPMQVDDSFKLPDVTTDRLPIVTIRWRNKIEKTKFMKAVTSFYYHPGIQNQQSYGVNVKIEQDGLAVRVKKPDVKDLNAYIPVQAYFLPTLHNEVKLYVQTITDGDLQIGWSDEKLQQVTGINLQTKQFFPGILNHYFLNSSQKDDMIVSGDTLYIKRVNLKGNGKGQYKDKSAHGIAIFRNKRSSDATALPFVFIAACEVGEDNFDAITIWLKHRGDCLNIIE